MAHSLNGFHIRSPRADEIAAVTAWFDASLLSTQDALLRVAFGQPGDVPLGAVMVRPADSGRLGRFLIHVRNDCRRRKIGTTLMHHLYELAMASNAQSLVLAELVHQDRAENAFCLSVGLTPQRSFATYSVAADAMVRVTEPLTERFRHTHPHLIGAEIVPLSQIDPAQTARFLAQQYNMIEDRSIQSFQRGRYDLRLSCALRRDGRMQAAALVRSRGDQPYAMVELIVAAPQFRHGPVAVALCARMARAALAHGFTGGVFEADERFDLFAAGLGRRCGAKPQWLRHRYAIDRAGMEQLLANPA